MPSGPSQGNILPSSRSQTSQRYQPVRLLPQTRKAIAERILHKSSLDQTVFDEAQNEIGHFLRNTAYLAFLESDFFISHMQRHAVPSSPYAQVPLADPCSDVHLQNHLFGPLPTQAYGALPTVDEDRELISDRFPISFSSKLLSQGQIQSQIPVDHCTDPSNTYLCNPHSQNCSFSNFVCTCSIGNQQSTGQSTLQQTQSNYIPAIQKKSPRGSCAISCFSPIAQPTTPVPLTQENIQITRFQRAELPVPQHLSSCPHCHTPLPLSHEFRPMHLVQQSNSHQHQTQFWLNSKKFGGNTARQPSPLSSLRTWVDAVCPKHQYYDSEAFHKAPPNPYHVSYAPVSAQDSERHSMSSGAYTDENLSLNDANRDESKPCPTKTHPIRRGGHPYRGNKSSFSPSVAGYTETIAFNQQNPGNLFSSGQQSTTEPVPGISLDTTAAHRGVVETAIDANPCRHQRRNMKANTDLGGRRVTPTVVMGGGELPSRCQTVKTSSASAVGANTNLGNVKETNIAEVDPVAFAKLLTDRLQRIVDNQAAIEKIDKLLSENVPVEDNAIIEIASPDFKARPLLNPHTCNSTTDSRQRLDEKAISVSTASSSYVEFNTAADVVSPSEKSKSSVKIVPSSASSVLQRPWADRLLAAARVQHEGDNNAQAILEDHCSRIWATSADRTPTSSGSRGSRQLDSSSEHPNQFLHGLQTEEDVEEEEVEELLDNLLPTTFSTKQFPSTFLTAASLAPENQFSSPVSSTVKKSDQHMPQTSLDPNHGGEVSPEQLPHRSGKESSNPELDIVAGSSSLENQPNPMQPQADQPCLVVGYYLCDDPVPYRSHWPSHEINLGQFKRLLPKKGPFRFFFKKASDEFGSGVVHQEISNDESFLPLWEGKVVAKVERID